MALVFNPDPITTVYYYYTELLVCVSSSNRFREERLSELVLEYVTRRGSLYIGRVDDVSRVEASPSSSESTVDEHPCPVALSRTVGATF
jgi:hypothetical protein